MPHFHTGCHLWQFFFCPFYCLMTQFFTRPLLDELLCYNGKKDVVVVVIVIVVVVIVVVVVAFFVVAVV